MIADNRVELHLPSAMGFEKVAMECAASVAPKMGFSKNRIEDLKTAVAEACLNAIEHGNKMDTRTKVGITLTAEESKLQVSVRDQRKGIDRFSIPNIESTIKGEDQPPNKKALKREGLVQGSFFQMPMSNDSKGSIQILTP